jgi:hypothetical protein
MKPPTKLYLNETHCACLDKVLQNSVDALDLATRLKECDCPVDDIIDAINRQKLQAEKLKAHFLPHKV